MRFSILASLATLLPLATAKNHFNSTKMNMHNINPMNQTTGNSIISNNCETPIYLWSVGSTVGPQIAIKPGHNYSEPFHHDQKSGGVALKVTTVMDGLYTSAPQTVFAYNLVEKSVWYDLSDVFGDPFEGEMVSLMPSMPEIVWKEGIPPSGSEVRTQSSKEDLVLSLC
ncbi:hypothetical protein AWENTII_011434 [Aspergillus wentii]|nr:hypothetical protein MW887_003899 [Aspergillus wentii]